MFFRLSGKQLLMMTSNLDSHHLYIIGGAPFADKIIQPACNTWFRGNIVMG